MLGGRWLSMRALSGCNLLPPLGGSADQPVAETPHGPSYELDDVVIWNRVLSQPELQQLYVAQTTNNLSIGQLCGFPVSS